MVRFFKEEYRCLFTHERSPLEKGVGQLGLAQFEVLPVPALHEYNTQRNQVLVF